MTNNNLPNDRTVARSAFTDELTTTLQTSAPKTRRKMRTARGRYGRTGGAVKWIDDRFGIAKVSRTLADKVFPDHWSFMTGEIALYSFVVLVATGIFLALYYVPSSSQVIYHGTYRPLDGQRMSQAYQSTVDLSFNVRAGLLMRQMHHWSADIFIGSTVLHTARVFFTGGFRNPRETNWYIGVAMLILAVFNGFLGYSLPDDLISGTGLRIGYSILESIPFVGSYLATLAFGGNFPGGSSLFARMYAVHILIIPLLLITLVGVHLFILFVQKHTQFKDKNRTRHNVVGSPFWPNFTAKTSGFLFMIAGGIALLGAFAQINPIWLFGSYDPSKVSYAVQPDWYLAWIDGAIRMMPSWEWTGWGHTIPLEVFLPGVVFPGIVFTVCLVWPALESRVTGDGEIHELLDRPRDRPKRTAFGAASLALLSMLTLASSTDVTANFLHLSLNAVVWTMRVLTLIVPLVVGTVTWMLCIEMQQVPNAGKRKRSVVVKREPSGEYEADLAGARPDDGVEDLEPTPVPDFVVHDEEELVTASGSSGVKRVPR